MCRLSVKNAMEKEKDKFKVNLNVFINGQVMRKMQKKTWKLDFQIETGSIRKKYITIKS